MAGSVGEPATTHRPDLGGSVRSVDTDATLIPAADGVRPIRTLSWFEVAKSVASVAGTSLSGEFEVSDPAAAISGQTVFAQNTTTGDVFSAVTLNDGSFLFNSVPPGGISAGSYTFDADGLLLTSNPPVIVGAGQAVTGVVLTARDRRRRYPGASSPKPSSLPVASASINPMNELDGTVFTVSSDQNGNYSFSGLPPGLYALTVDAAGFAQTVVTGVDVESGNAVEDVTMPAESIISGVVTPQLGGLPPGTLQVVAEPVDGSNPSDDFFANIAASVSSSVDYPRALMILTFNLGNYLSQTSSNVEVATGVTLDLGSISLAPAAVITGTVTSTDPQTAVAGATVAAIEGNSTVAVTQSDTSGSFTFDSLAAGTYQFALPGAAGLVTSPTVTVTAGQQLANVAVSVEPGGVIPRAP